MRHYRVTSDRCATFHMAPDAAAAIALSSRYLGYQPRIVAVAVEAAGRWQEVGA